MRRTLDLLSSVVLASSLALALILIAALTTSSRADPPAAPLVTCGSIKWTLSGQPYCTRPDICPDSYCPAQVELVFGEWVWFCECP